MPDYRTFYDRDYIGHFDLPSGSDLILTIKRVIGGELVAMGGRKSKKPIVHFQEESIKPLICNKTNSKTIATMYGNMTEGWVNKRITLFVSTTRSPDGSGEVECIRIRPQIPDSRVTTPRRVAAEPKDLAGDIETVMVTHPSATAASSRMTEASHSIEASGALAAADPEPAAARVVDGVAAIPSTDEVTAKAQRAVAQYLTPDQQIQIADECRKLGPDILNRLLIRARVGHINKIPANKYESCNEFIATIAAKAKP